MTLGNILGPSLFLAPLLWYNFYVTDEEISALNFRGHGHKPHPDDVSRKGVKHDEEYKLKSKKKKNNGKSSGKSSPKAEHVAVDVSGQTDQQSDDESKRSDTDPEVTSDHSSQRTARKTSLDSPRSKSESSAH